MSFKKLFFTIIIYLFTIVSTSAQTPNYGWAERAGGISWDDGRSTCVDSNGNVIVVGRFDSPTITFGATTLVNADNTGNNSDMFLVKYDSYGNVLWAKSFGAAYGDELALSVSTDLSDNIIMTGWYGAGGLIVGSINFIASGGSNPDIVIVKFDSSGNIIWAKNAGSTGDDRATSVATDPAGNVLLTGTFKSPTINFGSTTLTNSGPPYSTCDVFVAKYDPSGNVLWAKSAGGTKNDTPFAISSDPSGNLLVTGSFVSASITFGTTTFTKSDSTNGNIFVVKYNASGAVSWAKNAGGVKNDCGQSVCADASGNVLVTGFFRSVNINFGTDTLTNASANSPNIFLVKYDPFGNVLWAKFGGGVGGASGGIVGDFGQSVTADVNENVLLTGYFQSPVINFGSTSLNNAGFEDMFIVKYNPYGNIVWAQQIGGPYDEEGHSIVTDAGGNVLVTGMFDGTNIVFGSDTLVNASPLYEVDFFLTKLYNTSNLVWPGDANSNHVVDNNDLLEVGLNYGQTGPLRMIVGDLWQADSSNDWGVQELNGADIKHSDCNGDGTIDNNDTLAINLNFSLTHAFVPNNSDLRLVNPNLYFTSSSSVYPPGSWVSIDIIAGTSSLPVNNLYGIAFNLQYDASLVQSGTESLLYPNSWFASPGTDAIKIGKIDAPSSTAYAAETRINHTNADGYGKIATFRFQAKSSISSLTTMNFSFSDYQSNDSVGNSILFNPQSYSVLIDPLATSLTESENKNEISVFPNPNNGNFNVMFTSLEKSNYKLELINVLGQVVYNETLSDFVGTYSKPLSISNYGKGVYTITLTNDKNEVVKKIIVY
ncbi:MAG: T9SS type A sorting domain-containing protein [Bacteroidetes bacterium]|nr:T9SS type A sorting domain-containing protein [Bacteroidota bacterium]